MRKKWITIGIILFVLLGGCGCAKPTLYISGDSQAVGAEIYVDGQKVGTMEKYVYVGSTSKDLVVVEREKNLQQRLGIKPGDIFSGTEISIPTGKHEIMFVNKKGKHLKKDIVIQGESYIAVDFAKMIIQGGE
jgi:hypothetical protein